MAKKTLGMGLILIIIFSFAGCRKDGQQIDKMNMVEYIVMQKLIMNAGETHALDIAQINKDYAVDYIKYKLESSDENVITIKENVLTAVDNGFAVISISLYANGIDEYGRKCQEITRASCTEVFVINESTMTEITSAGQLADINNDLDGSYILKADIDLAGMDWQPLGTIENVFRGILINPRSYVIKNLTINSSERIHNNASTIDVGLFGFTVHAYIDGIILENVLIDISDAEPALLPAAGGIAGQMFSCFIANCKVAGEIYTQYQSGGIAGCDNGGIYKNCEFNGIVEAQEINKSCDSQKVSAGGIVGYYRGYMVVNGYSDKSHTLYNSGYFADEGIYDCVVNAEIISTDFAGGIYGANFGDFRPVSCTFTGSVYGEKSYGEMYGYCRWDI